MQKEDLHMAKNTLLTASTVDEMLKILSGFNYEQAVRLHELGQEMGCKIQPRTGAKAYRIQYSTVKPNRSLFTIECNEKRLRVKANLYHISQYIDLASASSDAIKNAVKSTRTCTRCNSRCIGGSRFELDGQTYAPCIGSGHFFENMANTDWEYLTVLLLKENEVIKASS